MRSIPEEVKVKGKGKQYAGPGKGYSRKKSITNTLAMDTTTSTPQNALAMDISRQADALAMDTATALTHDYHPAKALAMDTTASNELQPMQIHPAQTVDTAILFPRDITAAQHSGVQRSRLKPRKTSREVQRKLTQDKQYHSRASASESIRGNSNRQLAIGSTPLAMIEGRGRQLAIETPLAQAMELEDKQKKRLAIQYHPKDKTPDTSEPETSEPRTPASKIQTRPRARNRRRSPSPSTTGDEESNEDGDEDEEEDEREAVGKKSLRKYDRWLR